MKTARMYSASGKLIDTVSIPERWPCLERLERSDDPGVAISVLEARLVGNGVKLRVRTFHLVEEEKLFDVEVYRERHHV